nr:MAG TPA: hypothetical protein [Caudoviricetes sp.]
MLKKIYYHFRRTFYYAEVRNQKEDALQWIIPILP